MTQRSKKNWRSWLAARSARQSWPKIPDWLTNYNWTEVQAGLTDGQASAGDRSDFEGQAARMGSAFWPPKINVAVAGNGGDEGRFGSGKQFEHLVERAFESCGHVLTGHIAGGKNELADGMKFESEFFERVVAN